MVLFTATSFFLALGASALVTIVYRLYFSPLSHLPGPPITALSRLWIMYHEFKGDRTVIIDELHQRYGRVVRIAPDEVSFNSQDAIKDIYGIKSDFSKSSFYDLFIYYNQRNTFTSLTKSDVLAILSREFIWNTDDICSIA
jgi:hypothetical protein